MIGAVINGGWVGDAYGVKKAICNVGAKDDLLGLSLMDDEMLASREKIIAIRKMLLVLKLK